MEIRFREFNPFNCWIWLRFSNTPGQGERGYIDTAFESWFFLGKLGGFNAENLQVHEQGADVNWMAYDGEGAERALPALMRSRRSWRVRHSCHALIATISVAIAAAPRCSTVTAAAPSAGTHHGQDWHAHTPPAATDWMPARMAP